MHAFAVTVIGTEGLGVEAAIVRRIVAVDVACFDQIGTHVDGNEMADDALHDPMVWPAENLGKACPVLVIDFANQEFDVHREAMRSRGANCYLKYIIQT